MNTIMGAQENLALARSLFDLSNNHQSDPAWLEKGMAAFAADAEVIDVPSGTTLHGPDGYKRLVLFFAENFPDSRGELTDAFATEDQVNLERTVRWNDTGPLYLPSEAQYTLGLPDPLWQTHRSALPCYQGSSLRKTALTACSHLDHEALFRREHR